MTTTNHKAPTVPDHELLRRLLDDRHLAELLEIVDRARAFRGDPDCVEGGCDHVAVDGEQCALLVPVYATAEHLERLHVLRELVDRVHTLAVDGLQQQPSGMLAVLAEIADLTELERREGEDK